MPRQNRKPPTAGLPSPANRPKGPALIFSTMTTFPPNA